MAVDGVNNVIKALEEIENNKLTDLDFFEGLACTGGCVGGPLVFENGFVAKSRINTLCSELRKESIAKEKIKSVINEGTTKSHQKITPVEALKLDDNVVKAMRMMEEIEEIVARLPGLDCGSCGSPSCHALAEDIVRGLADEMDCIFLLKEKVRYLADEMEDLLKKL